MPPFKCCACEKQDASVCNVVCMPFKGPIGFAGWGCFVCDLEPNGAVAILCNDCINAGAEPRFIAGGKFASDGVLVPLEGFERKPFDHNWSKHPEKKLEVH